MLMYITGAKGILKRRRKCIPKSRIDFFSFRGLFTSWYSPNEGHIFLYFLIHAASLPTEQTLAVSLHWVISRV